MQIRVKTYSIPNYPFTKSTKGMHSTCATKSNFWFLVRKFMTVKIMNLQLEILNNFGSNIRWEMTFFPFQIKIHINKLKTSKISWKILQYGWPMFLVIKVIHNWTAKSFVTKSSTMLENQNKMACWWSAF